MGGKLRTEIVGHANEEITDSIYTHGWEEPPAKEPTGVYKHGDGRQC